MKNIKQSFRHYNFVNIFIKARRSVSMKRRFNILYIHHVSDIGGGSFCLLNIVKKLDKKYFNPVVLLKTKGPLSEELVQAGATVYYEKSISTALYNISIFKLSSLNQLLGVFKSISRIKFWIERTQADIVHVNTMMLYPYLFPAYQLKRKTVLHMRENWPKGEHQIQFIIAKKCIDKYADKIVSINKTSADILGISGKTEVVYDWIDFENRNDKWTFEKLFGRQFQKLKIFVFLGGTNWQKGALDVVDLFANEIVSDDVRLVVVGCADKDIEYHGLRGRLKKFLARFNYYRYFDKVKHVAQKTERIVFIPPTYKIKSLIEQSYCLVSYFTIPHANLPIAEAAWLGKPSIAADTPEAREYTFDGKSALLFTMNNKSDFKNKVLFAMKNEELINNNAVAVQSAIRKMFDPDINSTLLNNVYKILLEEE